MYELFQGIPDKIARHVDETQFHSTGWSALAEIGLFELFKHGFSAVDIMKGMQSLGEHFEDAGLTFLAGAHLFGSMQVLESSGSLPGVQKRALAEVRRGVHLAHAITEPGAGSDVFNMASRATQRGDAFHICGTKTYVSGLAEAEWILMYAMTNPEKGAIGGMSAFLLKKGEWEVTGRLEKMGLRSCSMGTFSIDCEVPSDRCVGGAGAGYRLFLRAMDWERVGLSAIHVGTMRKVLKRTIDYAQLRKQSGQSIASHQAIQFSIAEMATSVEASALLVMWAAEQLDRKGNSQERTRRAAMAKLQVSETFVDICRRAVQIHGGAGYVSGVGPERWLRDSLSSTIYSGTSEIQRKVIFSLL
jgi:alkylation response protein AidB-like acyl-CoA dehydrogenase